MIEIEGVSHVLCGRRVLADVSLRIPKGGVTALIGPNGAGKSTLLSLMARLERLQSGRIAFDGLDVAHTPTERLARTLAILRQETVMASRLTVRDLVGFGRYPHCRGRPTAEDHAAVEAALAALDLEALTDRYLDEISGGQRQRALIAMTFAQGTDYLLLDEPLNNLDLTAARQLMRRLREAATRHARTIVVVLHDINYAAAHADRIVGLRGGRVVLDEAVHVAMTQERLSAVFGTGLDVHEVAGRPFVAHYA